jgi:hypothetical protein
MNAQISEANDNKIGEALHLEILLKPFRKKLPGQKTARNLSTGRDIGRK